MNDVEQKYPEANSSLAEQDEKSKYKDELLTEQKQKILKKFRLTSEQLKDIQMEGLSKDWSASTLAKKQGNLQYIDAGYTTPDFKGLCFPRRWGTDCKKFPIRFRGVNTYKKIGPELWEQTNHKLPDKLPVIVVEKISGTVNGSLSTDLIEVYCADCDKPGNYIIAKRSLVKYAYWSCSSFSNWTDALKYGEVVAQLSNTQAEVLTQLKEWVELSSFDHKKIFCTSRDKMSFQESPRTREKVICYAFIFPNREGQYVGRYWFNPSDLTCIDQ